MLRKSILHAEGETSRLQFQVFQGTSQLCVYLVIGKDFTLATRLICQCNLFDQVPIDHRVLWIQVVIEEIIPHKIADDNHPGTPDLRDDGLQLVSLLPWTIS